MTYGAVLFRWIRGQLVMVDDYAYAGADFRSDPDLPLPEDEQWDNQGEKFLQCKGSNGFFEDVPQVF